MSEFGRFIDFLRTTGIHFNVHWAPAENNIKTKKIHQKILKEGGFNITALALNGICIGNQMFVFSVGEAHWTTGPDPDDMDQHKGHGPKGVFLYVFDMTTNKLINYRTKCSLFNGRFDENTTGLQALMSSYPMDELDPATGNRLLI